MTKSLVQKILLVSKEKILRSLFYIFQSATMRLYVFVQKTTMYMLYKGSLVYVWILFCLIFFLYFVCRFKEIIIICKTNSNKFFFALLKKLWSWMFWAQTLISATPYRLPNSKSIKMNVDYPWYRIA